MGWKQSEKCGPVASKNQWNPTLPSWQSVRIGKVKLINFGRKTTNSKTLPNITGWCFGFVFIFPYIGNSHPNGLSYFSEGLVYHQPDQSMWQWLGLKSLISQVFGPRKDNMMRWWPRRLVLYYLKFGPQLVQPAWYHHRVSEFTCSSSSSSSSSSSATVAKNTMIYHDVTPEAWFGLEVPQHLPHKMYNAHWAWRESSWHTCITQFTSGYIIAPNGQLDCPESYPKFLEQDMFSPHFYHFWVSKNAISLEVLAPGLAARHM